MAEQGASDSALAQPPTAQLSVGLRAAFFSLAYLLSAVVGSHLSPPSTHYVSFWLPAGVYLSALLITRRRHWHWMIVAAFCANVCFDLYLATPIALIACFFVINTLQAVLGALTFQRFVSAESTLTDFRDLFGLAWVSTLSTGLGALGGATTLGLFGASGSFVEAALGWWGSCAMATFVVVPGAVVWLSRQGINWPPLEMRKRAWELLLLWAALLSLLEYFLVVDRGIMAPYKAALFPLLLWIGVRFGLHGATVTSLLVSLVSAYWTTHFAVGLSEEDLRAGSYVLVLQTFLCSATLVTLVPAIAINARERALRELKDSEERFRQLAGAAFEAIVISERGKVIDCNDQALRLFGTTREAFLGRQVLEFVAEEMRELVAGAVKDQKELTYEHVLLRSDGTPFHGEAQARVVHEGSRVLRMTALRDVTDRRRAEAELRASEAVLRQFVKHAPAAIAIMDQNLRYLQASDRWLHDYQLEGQDIIGKTHYEVFPGLPDRWKEIHQRVLAGAVEQSDEDPFEREDGRTDWLQWEARPWHNANGSVAGLIFFTQVITERKEAEAARIKNEEKRRELEAQLRQAQKMEAVGTLAGGIAHDFNNILASIIAHAELVRLDYTNDPELQSNLAQVLQASHRAASLVQQILTFSRRQPQERRSLQIYPIVREALQMLRSTLPTTIEFRERFSSALPNVMADATQIHQVVVNLCTNAGHAMRGRQGVLTVSLESFEHTEAEAIVALPLGRYVRLSVQDTGHGMNEELVQRVFEPFFTTKAPGEGSGLGLAVVHGIVQEHRGLITVTSRVGEGTLFVIYLPATESAVVRPAQQKERPAMGQGQHILLVDDERALAEATSKLLSRYGYKLTVFNDSPTALSAFQAAHDSFDMLITDLTMPGMTGPELARQVRAVSPNLPIILTTGSRNDLTVELAREMGILEVFIKPLDYPALLNAIRRLLSTSVSPAETEAVSPTTV